MLLIGFLLSLLIEASFAKELAHYGVIFAQDPVTKDVLEKVCVTYNQAWLENPIAGQDDSPFLPLASPDQNLSGCQDFSSSVSYDGKAVILVDRNTCSVTERIANAEALNVSLVIIARITGMLNVSGIETELFANIPVVLINNISWIKLSELVLNVELKVFSPTASFDGNVLLIYVLCLFCVIYGSYWSLYPQDMKCSEFCSTTPKPVLRLLPVMSDEEEPESSACANWCIAATMVCFMGGLLLGTYYAYGYFVFFFIAVFCLISSSGVYDVVIPVVGMLPVTNKSMTLTWRKHKKTIYPIKMFIWCMCLGVALAWFFHRHLENIWPLQVFLGICVCLHIIRSVQMPNMKIILLVMLLLFVYDIFFVFITPYFTSDGVSVMEKVATGPGHGSSKFDAPAEYSPSETIPLSIKIPYFQDCQMKVCTPLYSLIGFGDIVIPGILVSYAAYFDTIINPVGHRFYFYFTSLSYAIGLLLTYIALMLMQIAQPALLYLVPCTLAGILGTGLARKEVKILWSGRGGAARMEHLREEESITQTPDDLVT